MMYARFGWLVLGGAVLLAAVGFESTVEVAHAGPILAEGEKPPPEKPESKADKEATKKATKKAEPAPKVDATRSIDKGLAYLVNQQQKTGGWGQGGGWRTRSGGGRIQEGNEGYQEPADVGNTAFATLALIRSGSTPSKGKYARQIASGVDFVCSSIEASDDDTLAVSKVTGTQIQRKIGMHVDTFLSALILTEVKGQMGSKKANARIDACLTKTIAKIEKNQNADGTFAGNRGWASVLSQGLSTKTLNRARQMGVPVSDEAIERSQKQVTESYDLETKKFHRSRHARPWLLAQAGSKGKPAEKKKGGDTKSAEAKRGGSNGGVRLYGNSANFAGMAEQKRTNEKMEKEAERVLADPHASAPAKAKATATIERAEEARTYYFSAREVVVGQIKDARFTAGFGSAGGEEYLSYMNISETLAAEGGEAWDQWNAAMATELPKVQNADGSWAGHHCITGRTFVTSAALLTLMADRAPVAVATAE